MNRLGQIHPCYSLTFTRVKNAVKEGVIKIRKIDVIPEKYVITDRLCGKGGYKLVYLAIDKSSASPKLMMCSEISLSEFGSGNQARLINEMSFDKCYIQCHLMLQINHSG